MYLGIDHSEVHGFRYSTEKVHLSRNSVYLGIDHSEVRNIAKPNNFPRHFVKKVILVFVLVLEWFVTSFRKFFLSLYSEYFSFLWKGSEQNSEHFYVLRNYSEGNYKILSVFIF